MTITNDPSPATVERVAKVLKETHIQGRMGWDALARAAIAAMEEAAPVGCIHDYRMVEHRARQYEGSPVVLIRYCTRCMFTEEVGWNFFVS